MIITIIKKILIASSLFLLLGGAGNVAGAASIKTGMAKPINFTVKHLEEALSAVDTNDMAMAQKHIAAARQTSKVIIGGTLAAAASRGSDAIIQARIHVKKNNKEEAAAALKEAIEIFKSMLGPIDPGSLGGLK